MNENCEFEKEFVWRRKRFTPYIFCDFHYPDCADNPNEPDFWTVLQALIPVSRFSPLLVHSDLFPLSYSYHPLLSLLKIFAFIVLLIYYFTILKVVLRVLFFGHSHRESSGSINCLKSGRLFNKFHLNAREVRATWSIKPPFPGFPWHNE